MAKPTSDIDRPKRELKVLSLGMTRTGSASITQALEMLGYQGVHHGIQALNSPLEWQLFNKACDSFFPILPTYTGAPFTRADWDIVFGPYEAVTDLGSFFAPQLIEAYPEAKVILVERDIDAWYDSMEEAIFSTTWGLRADLIINVLGPLYGLTGGKTIRKMMLGYYGVRNVHDMRRVAKDRYKQHYAEIRAAVPKERLLEFRLEDGWEPLCEFLDKDVPGAPFPTKNKRGEHVKRVRQKQNMFFKHVAIRFAKKAVPCSVVVGLMGLLVWKSRSRAQWVGTLEVIKKVISDRL
ncbi:hypothetical protein COCMIDRAFT_32804 [Bipolaris oryzae ATCC 44560]|uniref:P-loop containing nucleoside triphosphate hydrolase protein n=1 Tax=Bipolaris oryzae ATCC 44560 TaxID=930090 RepID=W6ZDA4_COCMI|nr:uncharacterized protein COCMIDRAFT_32804 [Bipolaris oryzae ATCC 44560]EUC49787.1 hypothetical protein COCMIDRAFT_32804 [Bipolaris oryzae ATCC 44560]